VREDISPLFRTGPSFWTRSQIFLSPNCCTQALSFGGQTMRSEILVRARFLFVCAARTVRRGLLRRRAQAARRGPTPRRRRPASKTAERGARLQMYRLASSGVTKVGRMSPVAPSPAATPSMTSPAMPTRPGPRRSRSLAESDVLETRLFGGLALIFGFRKPLRRVKVPQPSNRFPTATERMAIVLRSVDSPILAR